MPKKGAEPDKNAVLHMTELPNALENLSNALQTVQDLFKLNSSSSANSSNTITEQLNSLSSTILSSVAKSNILKTTTANDASSTSSPLAKKSPSSSVRKQKSSTLSINAPVYTPTPITELKKLHKQASSEEFPKAEAIKRKTDMPSTDTSNPC